MPSDRPPTRHLPEATTGIRALGPGGGLSAHRHDNPQLIYARSGVVAVTTDAGSWLAFPGRALWVPAGTVHEHWSFGAADLRLVGIPVPDDPVGATSPAVLGVDPLLRELLLAVTGETIADGGEYDRLVGVLLDRVRRAPRMAGQYLPAARDPRLVAVCRILLDDPAEQAGLAELGARVGAGERTLSRLFARELGMGFQRWRAALRLQHALILLAGGEPVTAVAHRCGWSSASAFIDAYRRTFGHTPGETRRAGRPGPARREGWPT
ncbi:AraC family transcriptional regulator [Actinomadura rupiterrae]|uniref:AraC family transcriptional regulator n=1 Tax=Actinomadura rupiterrae TaxID=559627 RepID=UPI002646D15D|nr:helix-turn-helix transcriptional regulator [Actinomadura rupiterrae]MCP2335913.1 AraC-like DNA-binding protein [Actinomadura rupiterrae]